MAEYILRMVPVGTHDPTKYCTPEELEKGLKGGGCKVIDYMGMHFNPILNNWEVAMKSPLELKVNYILTAVKK